MESTKSRTLRQSAGILGILDVDWITDAEIHYRICEIDESLYDLLEANELTLEKWYVVQERWERNKRRDAGLYERNKAIQEHQAARSAFLQALSKYVKAKAKPRKTISL